MNLSVANGFPPQTYQPLFGPLTDRYRVISILPRPLWPDPPAWESLISWRQIASDILLGLRQRDLTDVIAIGHSMGGVASVLAAISERERFRALVLLEPTFIPPLRTGLVRLLQASGQVHRLPLVKGALRRRSRFASQEEAYNYWRAKALFHDWPDEVLRLYTEGITEPSSDGGVRLAWSPHWEAQYYQHMFLDWQREVRKLRGLLPVLAIQGSTTDTFKDWSVHIMRRLVPGATFARIEGHGHLFPQSAADLARQIIEDWLVTL